VISLRSVKLVLSGRNYDGSMRCPNKDLPGNNADPSVSSLFLHSYKVYFESSYEKE
jgi:hypothetical protein